MTLTPAEPFTDAWTYVLALPFTALAVGPDHLTPISAGMPAGTCLIDALNLVVAATPCSAPMFAKTVAHVAQSRGHDVLLVRAGFAPETMDPVRVDVALIGGGPVLLSNMAFFRHVDRSLWLVPEEGEGPFVLIDPSGLTLVIEQPFEDEWERSDGLARAAAQIVRTLRARER